MNKCYYRIVWENYPSDKTPLHEQNLNRIDVAADEMDNRIISLDSAKFDKSEAQQLVKYIEYDESTGIFKITHYNGASYTIDTLLEKLAINFDYDYQTQRLIIELSDGTVKYVDLSALITQYEFLESDTVHFSIGADGKVQAEVKEGSIQEKHLRPDYLADIKVEVAKAESSATAAEASKTAAAASATTAITKAGEASVSAQDAANSAATATEKATAAGNYATNAASSAASASNSATTAAEKSDESAASAINAADSASTASAKANAASASATAAAGSATSADTYAKKAQSYAVGTGGVRPNEATDSAKYYYEQSKGISEGLSGVLQPMGTIAFSRLPSLADAASGWMYNISDQFTTTAEFREGAGHTIPAGANIYKTADGFWDVLAGTPVTGVKGSSETSYRKGNVNLTADDIGALPLAGGTMDSNAVINFEQGWFDVDAIIINSDDGCTTRIAPNYIFIKGYEGRTGFLSAEEVDTNVILTTSEDITHEINTGGRYPILDSNNLQKYITQMAVPFVMPPDIKVGTHVEIATNNEGGNYILVAPDGTRWEIDAYNGNLRIFTYANNVKTGIIINKFGQVTFPFGAWSDTFAGTLHGPVYAAGGVGGRGVHINANEIAIDLPPEEGYAGGLIWYQGSTAVGCVGYYKQGGYYYIGTDYENPDGELFTGHIHVKYGCGLFTRHIEGAGNDAMLFLNYNHPNSSVCVGDVAGTAGGTGHLYIGTKAAIWADTEGGNVRIMSPNDVEYQMDAFNDNLRLYRHVGDDYRSAFVVLEDGTTDFPFGVVTDYICGTTGQYGRISITPNYPGRYKVLNDSTIHIGFDNEVGYCVAPYSDNHYMLGRALRRWKDVYAANSAIITSDESLKRDITPLDENMTKDFIMGLQPISYIRTDGESGRTHYGMGAQSVERLMEELGMTSMDFAGLIKSPMHEDYEVEEEVEVEKLVPNENGKPISRKVREIQKVTKQREIPGRYRYGLRYEEFIAPLIKMVQMQQEEIEELKKTRDGMMRRLEKIEKAFFC